MASYTGVFAVHKTLTANAADTVTLTGGATRLEIINRTGTAEIYFTVGQPVTSAANLAAGAGNNIAAPVTPVALANDTYVVPAVVGSYEVLLPPNMSSSTVVVELISTTAEAYSVVGTNL